MTKQFDNLIIKYCCLYDCNCINYNDYGIKKRCREYLLEECNSTSNILITMTDLRRKISTFQRKLRRRRNKPSKSFIHTSPEINPTELQPKVSRPTDLVEDPCASETPQQAKGRETDVQAEAITMDENTDSEHGFSTHNDSDGTASLPEPACGVKSELPEAPCDTEPYQENDATQKRTLDTILACLMQQERQNGPSKSFILTSPEINAIVLQEQEPGPLTDLVEDPCASETPQQAMSRDTDVKAEDITIDENTDSEPGLSTHNDSDGTASLPEPACGVKAELPEAPCDTGPCQENDATQKSTLDTILACFMRQERVATRAQEAQAHAQEAQAYAQEAQARANEAQARAQEAQERAQEAQARAQEAQMRSQEAQALAFHKIVQLLGETERR